VVSCVDYPWGAPPRSRIARTGTIRTAVYVCSGRVSQQTQDRGLDVGRPILSTKRRRPVNGAHIPTSPTYHAVMELWWPPHVMLVRDAEPARWVVERLWPWDSDGRTRVGSWVPAVFEDYARLLHPTYRRYGDIGSSTWLRVSHDTGGPLHAESSFTDVWARRPQTPEWDEAVPLEGTLPRHVCIELANILTIHTSTPEDCWFCVWEGWGSTWYPQVSFTYDPSDPDAPSPGEVRARGFAEAVRRQHEFAQMTASVERVRIPARTYFLFRGPLASVGDSFGRGTWQSPSMWWPDDRSWFVATEVDAWSTYIAGSSSLIDTLLSHPWLEVLRASVDGKMAF
jgi:hypothetical protein